MVARKLLVNVVYMQATECYPRYGPMIFVGLFPFSFVSEMTLKQLKFIAEEDTSTRRIRAEPDRETAILEVNKRKKLDLIETYVCTLRLFTYLFRCVLLLEQMRWLARWYPNNSDEFQSDIVNVSD